MKAVNVVSQKLYAGNQPIYFLSILNRKVFTVDSDSIKRCQEQLWMTADVVSTFTPALHLHGFQRRCTLSNQHLFNIQNDCQDPLPSTVYDVKVLRNEFSAEQQIISYHILYLLLMKTKCQNVTLIPVRDLIRGKT